MGYLLKEALKTLCGVNQWSYAVFWKISCQNPKLLIWEECYYEPLLCPLTSQASGIGRTEMDLRQWEGSLLTQLHSGQPEIQARERIQLLIDQMMIKNQINIVGEGIIGRAAFTGHHEWILAKSYNKDAHPPEVLNEMQNQFSAGMQTVAVIPVSPHGVVQLGSSLSLTENLGFINDVKSLILQLGCIPGALFSDGYAAKVGLPGSLGIPSIYPSDNIKVISQNSLMSDHCKQLSSSSRPAGSATHQSPLVRHMNEVSTLAYQTSDQFPTSCVSLGGECYPKVPTAMKRGLPFEGQSDMGKVGAELFPADLDMLLNQNMDSCKGRNQMNHQPGGNGNDSDTVHKRKFSDGFIGNLLNSSSSSSSLTTSQLRANDAGTRNTCGGFESTASIKGEFLNGTNGHSRKISPQCCPSDTLRTSCANIDDFKLQDCDSSNLEGVPLFRMTGQTTSVKDPVHSPASAWVSHPADTECMKNEHTSVELLPDWIYNFEKHNCGSQSTITSVKFEDMSFQKYSSGNDLFDILGMEFKKKVIDGNFPSLVADGPDSSSGRMRGDIPVGMNVQEAGFGLNPMGEGFLDESVFSGAGGDHLLDAVVSKAQSVSKQGSDDNLSCKTTVTKISSSSVPSSSPTYHGASDHMEREMTCYPKPLEKLGNPVSCSFKSSCSKEGPCSPSNSFYGSQISSWVEQSHAVKVESSVSTAYSKKPDGTTKSNRKRLKPGENPRPRPKDRQMIQDRVKELREIVPNGAKCSIDALLERTIKHMLFLQSVTKHADKLKESGESEIINKEGGLLLKDNFEGGATWAFEVDWQSMVCPIIVEDLNPPRQMLVEMLCEDRGFFLEIADMVRGLGLTILKGVMEARNDKIWARFAVEANRDVTRMEIFLSLVRLLEQTVKGGPLAAKAIESNQTVHNSFAQATSIPATSRPN